MSRLPNPWIAIPALSMGVLAAALGWVVTDVSCRQPDPSGVVTPCNGWAALVAALSFIAVTIGVAVLLVLVFRSLAEWRERP
ncbi:MAG TPA: hypothetical protein VMQ46_05445 [Acidimicrobiia bacterium]|jgi:hypothetical protein|nr:hypothetical protein [Acidimicrobiia bacterium]